MVELGCGFGQDTRNLAQAGYRVLGVDVSSSAVEKAKRLTDAAMLGHGPGQVGAAPPRNLAMRSELSGPPSRKRSAFFCSRAKLSNRGLYSFKRDPVASPRQRCSDGWRGALQARKLPRGCPKSCKLAQDFD